MPGILQGIRILEFCHFAAGPFGVQMLADMGADVIKIERPGTGDFERSDYIDSVNGESPWFMAMNRNKRDLCIDLKNEKSKEVTHRLIRTADVVVTNFRPEVMKKLGYGYEKLRRINPKIIYASVTGYGDSGPFKNEVGQDLILQAVSGLIDLNGGETIQATCLVDNYTASLLAYGVVLALLARERYGIAQKIEVTMLDSALHLLINELSIYINGGTKPSRPYAGRGNVFLQEPYGVYRAKDKLMVISLASIPALCKAIHVQNLQNDPKYNGPRNLFDNMMEMHTIIQRKIRKKASSKWLRLFASNDIWCSVVNSLDDVVDHPQVKYRHSIQQIKHPVAGKIKLVAPPVRFAKTPASISKPSPLLGQHTHEILCELGYSSAQIDGLEKSGVVYTWKPKHNPSG